MSLEDHMAKDTLTTLTGDGFGKPNTYLEPGPRAETAERYCRAQISRTFDIDGPGSGHGRTGLHLVHCA